MGVINIRPLETIGPGWMRPTVKREGDDIVVRAQSVDSAIRSAILHGDLNASETPGDRLRTDIFNGYEKFHADLPMRDGTVQTFPLDFVNTTPTDNSPGYRMMDNYVARIPKSAVDLNRLEDPAVGARVYAELQGSAGGSAVIPATENPIVP